MHFVYLLYSEHYDRFYVGQSHNIEERILQHNSGKVRSTKPYLPWKVVYSEAFESIEQARAREVYFKSAAGRRFLKDIKKRSRVPDSATKRNPLIIRGFFAFYQQIH